MSRRFAFTHETRDGLHLARWLGDPEVPGWKRDDLWGSSTPPFIRDYGMGGSAGLLYPALLSLVWRLTMGLDRFAIPTFDGIANCRNAGVPYEVVRWEYDIAWAEREWQVRDLGFVAAEDVATVHESDGVSTGRRRFRGAALATVSGWPELMSITPSADQANTMCVVGLPHTSDARGWLVETLQGDERPDLATLLTDEDSLLAVTTQEDEGLGRSSVLIAGRDRMRQQFASEAERLEGRLERYLDETAAARTLDEWGAAVGRLARLEGPQPQRRAPPDA